MQSVSQSFLAQLMDVSQQCYSRTALRREKYGILAFTLLDGGSGNEVVTGCVRKGKSISA